ncbi:hypothetical protein B4923_06855 [Brenneria roseae subsp. americana]|uniref:Uncharacterized protein n=1 Tax=Brenneria roseae subsp. americana TaxID=1508507 RepID=A0A2U1TW73_9GAMM|nr:hypothetical protein [Brenneria roseae]PWC13661.1 hypothetical protein B4923_06855 [Brenneria roseae subsp. americana]
MKDINKTIDQMKTRLPKELTNTLLPEELNEGDVLLFSPEKGSFISWAITFLTNAPVSHAAMLYKKSPLSIIEESPPQVAVNEALHRFHDRTIYVYRHASQQELSPVITAATLHRNNLEPYDNASLYIVGILLLYKKISFPTLAQKVILRILKKLTATLTQYLQQHKNPGKMPMVCSQFVAQCFEDAGSQFQLHFHHQLLIAAHGQNLLDRAVEFIDQHPFSARNTVNITSNDTVTESDEELCRALYAAIDSGMVNNNVPAIDPELAQAIEEFAGINATLSGTQNNANTLTATHQLQANMNMFVFPGDLLQHCTSLKPVGKIEI